VSAGGSEPAPLAADDVARLFRGAFRGVLLHVLAFGAGTLAGAVFLSAAHGHDPWNVRFWYSAFLVAGFVVTCDAVLQEWLLARDLARAGTSRWRYRSAGGIAELRNVVVFALATLPAAILTALFHRRVVLDGEAYSGEELLLQLAEVGGLTLLWSLTVTGLLRAVERRAAGEALAVIRGLDAAMPGPRANVVTGGAWGETASALNAAADAIAERGRLLHAVRTYVGDDVADAARAGDVTARRGERVTMTVLFADVRGFTARSAAAPPEEIVAFLDAWFDGATEVVARHGGHVDKFIGDGLMAWFEEPGSAARAVAAAGDLVGLAAAQSESLERAGRPGFRIGVGLHAGPVVRGNLGAGRRKQWTVIGDTVNLASRLESLTKELGAPVVFTSAVADGLPPGAARSLGDVAVRGQPAPVACYTCSATATDAERSVSPPA
jgi:class 3 adenylate cyclase